MKSLQFASAPLIVTERKASLCVFCQPGHPSVTLARPRQVQAKAPHHEEVHGSALLAGAPILCGLWVAPLTTPWLGARAPKVTHALQEPRRCDQVEFLSVKSYNKEPTHHH